MSRTDLSQDDTGGLIAEVHDEHQRWWRLAFLREEVVWAERHLAAEVERARDRGWSWRRLAAATGIPAETLRRTYGGGADDDGDGGAAEHARPRQRPGETGGDPALRVEPRGEERSTGPRGARVAPTTDRGLWQEV